MLSKVTATETGGSGSVGIIDTDPGVVPAGTGTDSPSVTQIRKGQMFLEGYKQTGTALSERRYISGHANATALTTGTVAANTLYALPITFANGGVVDLASLNVTTGAAGNARLGLYSNASPTSLYPFRNVFDTDSLDTTAIAVLDCSVYAYVLPDLLYWGVGCFDATPGVATLPLAACYPILGTTSAWAAAGIGWTVAHTYAALPDVFPGGGTVLNTVPVPAFSFRLLGI